ncbi:MAG: tRNA (5-methylaminomethyl-2-thiouridine)(34)-methyltransferase MnmD [Sphingobacteriales bacterium]|nr:tRNA (5-methylaminomethyl-2-thiouridine)(34)-methyltransferase MnmD [Sphingobacteriales bacterium]
MVRKIILTDDGSHSISVPELNVTYHSVHGAIQESMHVFIEAGLYGSGRLQRPDPISILEIGFGTGLNALLTLIEAEKTGIKIHYEALELYPLSEEIRSLNYCQQLNRQNLQQIFEQMHSCEWEKDIAVSDNFILQKKKYNLLNLSTCLAGRQAYQPINLIYFDAFAPAAQPELWTKEVFDKMYSLLAPGGILVTYCSKADVRRAMIAAGFSVEKIPGPPHKREMLRARK